MACIFCSRTDDGNMNVITHKGIKSIIRSSMSKNDDFHLRLNVSGTNQLQCHNKCRLLYMKQKNTVTDCLTISSCNNTLVNEANFDFSKFCIICGISIIGRNDVHTLGKINSLSVLCKNKTEQPFNTINMRLLHANAIGYEVNYHHKCYRKLFNQSCSDKLPSNSCLRNSSIIDVASVNSASNHRELLESIARHNNLSLCATIGGGDCFFHAIQQSLSANGRYESICSLRQLIGNEMILNCEIYKELYLVDEDGASDYNSFVDNTINGHEWATEITIAAMGRALNIAIYVVSTGDNSSGHPTAFVRDFVDDVVNVDEAIIVGYIRDERHYVALLKSNCNDRNAVLSASESVSISAQRSDHSQLFAEVKVSNVQQIASPESTGIMPVRIIASVGSYSSQLHAVSQSITEPIGQSNTEFALPHADMMDAAMEIDVEALLPSANSFLHTQCSNCRRTDSTILPLNIQSYQGKFTHRRLCLLSKNMDTYELCSLCAIYLTKTVQKSSFWHCAWPSVIAYLLSNQKYAYFRKQLWQLLPHVYREMWQTHADSVGLQTNNNLEPIFKDFTDHLCRWNALKNSGVISDFIIANTEYAFPCVKCPAGCFAYIDECHFIPFHHFLAWKHSLSFFDADCKYFSGARHDWPSSSLQLGVFHVKPGLIVDDVSGLCIMMCKGHAKHGLVKPIIHVPLNPVLGDDGFQSPDTLAAAVLTPNVIRAGRMGKWTNSSHVIAAIGGYTGISSSSIAQKVDSTVQDCRLSASSYLAMEHRIDVSNIVRERFTELPNGNFEFARGQSNYDVHFKPSVEVLCSSTSGATFVDVSTCSSIHESLFSRDASTGNALSDAKDDVVNSLMLTFVHRSTANGCKPVDLSCTFSPQKHAATGTLLKLLIHCPPVHNVILKAYDAQRTDYLSKLLNFVHYVCRHSNRCKKRFANADHCEMQTCTELQKRNLSIDDIPTSIAMLLASISSDVAVKFVSIARDFEELSIVARNVEVLLVCRKKVPRWQQQLPERIGELFLVQVLIDSRLNEQQYKYYFRWSEIFAFWYVTYKKRKQVDLEVDSKESLMTTNWKVLVYARACNVENMNKQLEISLQGQRKMRCADHKLFLAKQSIHSLVACCISSCTRMARWGCMGRGSSCPHAVCLSHGEAIIRGDELVDVECGMMGRRLKCTPKVAVAVDDVECIDDPHISDNDSDDDYSVLVPIGVDDFSDDNCGVPLHSRKDIIPIFDVNRHLPSHYLWNNKYNIMKRADGIRSNVQCNGILEHIVVMSGTACVSILYPEAQLFPRIFWHAQSNSISGAIPSFMLNCAYSTASGMASITEHLYVRLRDGDLLTAKENGYWHYVFDVLLNKVLFSTSSQLVFKRGLEFLLENKEAKHAGQNYVQEARMPMDEAEALRRVKELASLLKKGKWTYFLTITVNDTETPGVREITKAIHQQAGDDVNKLENLTTAFLPFVLRAWERFVRLFLQELVMRNSDIIGKVKNLFYRFEFQGAGAKGNKPHVHCGITLEEEPESVSVARIYCSSLSFHTSLYGSDFDTLKSLGVFADINEYERWREIVSCVNHHDCSKTQFRCMKATNAEGEKICRYHRQPPLPITSSNGSWFEPIAMPYSDEAYALLEEMGLARKTYDNVTQCFTWHVDDCLSAGKWHYYARGDEFFLSSIPIVSAICRSSTNVDMCDRKFQVSYLVKYVAGKEEHQLVDVCGSRDINEVSVTTEQHAHEKITHCSQIVAAKEKTNPHKGREISLAEVVWFNLGFSYTYCTADFIHVSTLPMENRVGILRNKPVTKNIVGENNVLVPVTERINAHLPQWRLFTDHQVAHIEDYLKSRYCLDPTSAFNIRPPELMLFDKLVLYSEWFVSVGYQKTVVKADVSMQPWFDGLSRRVMLRSTCVGKAIAFVSAKIQKGNTSATEMMQSVFKPIQLGNVSALNIFVQFGASREKVTVTSFVKPWDRSKFVTHLCLSLGTYATESDVFCCRDMKTAFVNCGLLQSSTSDVTRTDILGILKKYVVNDLAFHPISSRQFAK